MTETVDPELLISLVESRPGLWDKSLHFHKDFLKRSAAWRDISRVLNPDYDQLSRKDKHIYVKMIIKKWTNIRDAWRKSVAEDRRKSKPYIYHERLQFLQKNLHYRGRRTDRGDVDNSTEETDGQNKMQEDESDDASASLAGGSSGHRISSRAVAGPVEAETRIQFMDVNHGYQNEENPHILFTRGLLGTLNKLDDDETLEFQMGVIKLLQDIRKRSRVDNQFDYMNATSSSFDMQLKKDIL